MTATVQASTLDLRFPVDVRCAAYCPAGFTLPAFPTRRSSDLSTGSVPESGLLRLVLFEGVPAGAAVVLSYNAGNITDTAGDPITSFSGFLVTNLVAKS